MARKDITISLDEEQIDKLLEIAETRNTTLSAFIREIIASFLIPSDRQQLHLVDFSPDELIGQEKPEFRSTLAKILTRHGDSINKLEARLSVMEGYLHLDSPEIVSPPDIRSVRAESSFYHAHQASSVIDCDLPSQGGLSDEALVKIHRSPVLPVMDAIEMGSFKISPNKDYSQTEAAVALNVSVSTMRKYIKERRIDARKVGRSWLVHGYDILAFLENE